MKFKNLLELVYPSSIYCSCCESIIDKTRNYGLCDKCIKQINWTTAKTCDKCGKVIDGTWQGKLCADCMEQTHYFDKGYSCAEYELHTRRIIFDFKYNEKTYLAKDIAKAMRDKLLLEKAEYDIITSVPISKGKLRERGFNQAALIAKCLSKSVEKPHIEILCRTRETAAQRALGKAERYLNLKGVFKVKPYFEEKIKGKDILLIDDIYTTGATVDHCSKALKDAGAGRVFVMTFAAGGNRHKQEETEVTASMQI